jgi:hypothetical protein
MQLSQWTANRGASPQDAPTAPTLAVTGQGCVAVLSIQDASDNEGGFNVYRLDPGAMSFMKLTSLPDFFNALMKDGAINGVLAPVIRPDPCVP